MKQIDINCDLGEGLGNEALLMPYLSSCNIACGGHAGNAITMAEVAGLAEKYNVKIGAHPSFPDKENFGRKPMEMTSEALYKTLTAQILALKTLVNARGLALHHVKSHGALYNIAAVNSSIANTIVSVVSDIDPALILYVPYKSIIAEIAAEKGLRVMYEAFADRNYNDDLTLVSRDNPMALINDGNKMFVHVYDMISNEKVTSVNGVEVGIKAETFCVHGDHKNVIKNLADLVRQLKVHNIEIS